MRSASPWKARTAAVLAMMSASSVSAQQPADAPLPTARYEHPPPQRAPQPQPYSPPPVVAAPPAAPAPPAPIPPQPEVSRPRPSGPMVELQIGAFADRANAERAARAAQAAGPTRIKLSVVGGVTYHRVIVGPGPERTLRESLARLGFKDIRPTR